MIAERQLVDKQLNFVGGTSVRAPSISKSGYFFVYESKQDYYSAMIKFKDRPKEDKCFADKHAAAKHVDDCLYEHDLLRYLKYANFKESERYTAALARYKKDPSVAAAPTGRAAVPAKKPAAASSDAPPAKRAKTAGDSSGDSSDSSDDDVPLSSLSKPSAKKPAAKRAKQPVDVDSDDDVDDESDASSKPADCAACDKPNDQENMVGCEGPCGKWYHYDCADFDAKENAGKKWVCKACAAAAAVPTLSLKPTGAVAAKIVRSWEQELAKAGREGGASGSDSYVCYALDSYGQVLSSDADTPEAHAADALMWVVAWALDADAAPTSAAINAQLREAGKTVPLPVPSERCQAIAGGRRCSKVVAARGFDASGFESHHFCSVACAGTACGWQDGSRVPYEVAGPSIFGENAHDLVTTVVAKLKAGGYGVGKLPPVFRRHHAEIKVYFMAKLALGGNIDIDIITTLAPCWSCSRFLKALGFEVSEDAAIPATIPGAGWAKTRAPGVYSGKSV